ncbi:hypothetical protein GCK72_008722 [Caenorhabditis remanei]|uniref:Uncharacterized protein n=1 Tax=Caenorhabditis remanei TaxID=31234 RepID=A0A6A5H1L5_CAERE|nr:hypothetical protein GCK72_008722 [Caenorhabditis remanei]KAF1760473.1 hypothetical protein GCK72_008722 [Caenorhabditis remanei]
MSSDSSSAYVNVAAPGATASFPDESTLTEKDIGQPIQKISKKKIVENKSGPISPSSPATPLECCLCGYPGCKGREAYENLVNKPLDVPAISLPVDSERWVPDYN